MPHGGDSDFGDSDLSFLSYSEPSLKAKRDIILDDIRRMEYLKVSIAHEKDCKLFLAFVVLFAGGIVGAALLGLI